MSSASENIKEFVAIEKTIFQSQYSELKWADSKWLLYKLFPDWKYSKTRNLNFEPITKGGLKIKGFLNPPKGHIIPSSLSDIMKAIIMHLVRVRRLGANAAIFYNIAVRGLYHVMYSRSESDFKIIKNYHFTFLEDYYYQSYSNPRDAYQIVSYIAALSEIIDKYSLTITPIVFSPSRKPFKSTYSTPRKFKSEGLHEKEISREALEAYAKITNSPETEGEEILLRAIDLLLATGKRGGEICTLPLDCLTQRTSRNSKGEPILDKTGSPVLTYGIKYFPEKGAETRVDWLADCDVPFAMRAIERLSILCKKQREIALFQRMNPGRLFPLPENYIISDEELLEFIPYNTNRKGVCKSRIKSDQRGNLRKTFIKSLGIPTHKTKSIKEKRPSGRYYSVEYHYYKISDIEKAIYSSGKFKDFLSNHVGLASKDGKILLYKDQLLILPFHGAHRLKQRAKNSIKIFVKPIDTMTLNNLISQDTKASETTIFEKRGYTEADGSPINLSTHLPRHWRNTIYEIAGLTEEQQRHALGRRDISQNRAYQHATIEEKNEKLKLFKSTFDAIERASLFRDGIKEGWIGGDLSEAYNELKINDPVSAQNFLENHVVAAHVTPYGACSHDFAKAPCPKHLKCFDNCGHLHRTSDPKETNSLLELKAQLENTIDHMKKNGEGDIGADMWIKIQQKKLDGVKKALRITIKDKPEQVFKDGIKFNNQPRSGVRD